MRKTTPVSTHWGNFLVETEGNSVAAVQNRPEDESPTAIGQSLIDAMDEDVRIAQPMIREGYFQDRRSSDGSMRGKDPFRPVSWKTALDIAAEDLAGIKSEHGNEAIFGGSYGWASAGRFHHSQSQIHRFLNMFGGYVSTMDSYSVGAGARICPYTTGLTAQDAVYQSPNSEDTKQNADLMVCFGGIAMKNIQVNAGGVGNHSAQRLLLELKDSGIRFVNFSPLKDDMADDVDAEWQALRPNTDVAVMLGLMHTLLVEDLHDKAFLKKFTVGFDRFTPYLLGNYDGQPKDADWASKIADVPAQDIKRLAREMASKRTLVVASWSLQRAEHGEQPWWAALVLAAMLGDIGIPGCGIAYGYGSVHNAGFFGKKPVPFKIGHLPQGENPVATVIPVARMADLLLNPGATIDFDGGKVTYPQIHAVMWAGGNPFHHHQDLNRLVKAWAKPQTIIVNEINWNSLARHADIVFPATTSLERNDIAMGANDHWLSPSRKALGRYKEARDDYDVYTGLAERLGFADEFTEGRNADEWVEHLYCKTIKNAELHGVKLPSWEEFWSGDPVNIEPQLPARPSLQEMFRADPEANPLPESPSGKIEIFSEKIDSFGYQDCLGHPVWFEKREWLGAKKAQQFPLHLISNQPRTRLHSQYDHGRTSRDGKERERSVVRVNPADAQKRGIKDGDIVRLFNERGACLAAVRTTQRIRNDVIELPTGAWFDPEDPERGKNLDVHGNPNVLTQDVGSSSLGQGCSAHSCLVEMEIFDRDLPEIKVFKQPNIIT